jgi:5'-deoxynucleotidase YfbR-like HD superfamily hydrolase
MRCAMMHDLFEISSGDMPAPMKSRIVDREAHNREEKAFIESRFPGEALYLHELRTNPEIRAIIKAADLLDANMFLALECGYGSVWVGSRRDGPQESVFGSNFAALVEAWYNLPAIQEADRPQILDMLMEIIGNATFNAPRVVLRSTPKV